MYNISYSDIFKDKYKFNFKRRCEENYLEKIIIELINLRGNNLYIILIREEISMLKNKYVLKNSE